MSQSEIFLCLMASWDISNYYFFLWHLLFGSKKRFTLDFPSASMALIFQFPFLILITCIYCVLYEYTGGLHVVVIGKLAGVDVLLPLRGTQRSNSGHQTLGSCIFISCVISWVLNFSFDDLLST